MISEQTYSYLVSWLCPAMEAEYKALYAKGSEGGKLRGWKGEFCRYETCEVSEKEFNGSDK